MSISESKTEGNEAAPEKSTEANVAAEIEDALNFLDSEEHPEDKLAISDTAPRITGIDTPQSSQHKGSTAVKAQHKKISRPRQIEKPSPPKTPTPLKDGKSKKSGKIWVLTLGIAILILLATLFLYKMI